MANFQMWSWLRNFPGFAVKGSQVKIITSPDHFYSTLLSKASTAEKRICIASLYLGNGPLEKTLVETLRTNMEKSKGLKVKVLLDYARGSRGDNSSRKMLLPLIENSQSCQVFLYHTPNLRGFVKLLPERWNEIIGLQHMKIYIFDNTLLMSGANLSNDYFTNRQDRYVVVEGCEEMANFFEDLIDQVTEFSFKLDKSNNTCMNPNWKIHPSEGHREKFILEAKKRIESMYKKYQKENIFRLPRFQELCDGKEEQFHSSEENKTKQEEEDTWIFPLIQMGALNIGYDNYATCKIFEDAPTGSKIKLATGYFNLTEEYIQKILRNSAADYDILMAHPKANGFLGAKGFAGAIPSAYTQFAKQFYNRVKAFKQEQRINMWEYVRQGWTFHAKGLWFYPAGQSLPFVTLVGSPNFGHRSVYRDLETQLYVITTNSELQTQLHEEHQVLYAESKPFDTQVCLQRDRFVPIWVRVVMIFFKRFF